VDTEDPVIKQAMETLASIPEKAKKLSAAQVIADQQAAVREANRAIRNNEFENYGPSNIQILRPLLGLKKAELTINNGTYDMTFVVEGHWKDMPGKRGSDRKKNHEQADWHFVSVHSPGTQYKTTPVAVIFPKFGPGANGLPEYVFKLSTNKRATKLVPIIYAAHIVFLQLSGVNIQHEEWIDATGQKKAPTNKYEIQAVTSCMCCGRQLYKPSSIDRGFGPVCAVRIAKAFGYDTKAFRVTQD